MNRSRRVLLIIGSPKRLQSVSASLGAYLLEQLERRGFSGETVSIQRTFTRAQGFRASALDKPSDESWLTLDNADLVVLSFPLYIDSIPAPVIKAMEHIADRGRSNASKEQRLMAMVNSGFPEPCHSDTALAICRRFARDAGFLWTGGVAVGGGGALRPERLQNQGGMARNAMRALESAAEALADGKTAEELGVDRSVKTLIPAWAYVLAGNAYWKKRARRHGVRAGLDARPYLEGSECQDADAHS